MLVVVRVESLASGDHVALPASLSNLFAGNFNEDICAEPPGIYKLGSMSQRQLVQALVNLPNPVTGGAKYPTRAALEEIRQQAHLGGIPTELLYSLFTTPLIANDLPTVAVAAVACAHSQYVKQLRTRACKSVMTCVIRPTLDSVDSNFLSFALSSVACTEN